MSRLSPGALAVLMCVGSSGCATLHHEVRTERGETIRHFERKSVVKDAGVSAELTAKYPELSVRFTRHDACKTESVDEFPETTIDEATSPAAGPALATGIVATVAGAGVLAARGAFSNVPNRKVIDETGRYGAPPRTVATAWGIVGVGVGVPGLVTALVQYLQQGTRVTQATREDVVRTEDLPCHVSPLDGEVLLTGSERDTQALKTQDAQVTVTAAQMLAAPFTGFIVAGQNVLLTPAQESTLSSFEACARLLEGKPRPIASLARPEVKERRTLAVACNRLPGEPAKSFEVEATKLLEADDAARSVPTADSPQPARSSRPEMHYAGYEDALAKNPPRWVLEPGSADLAKLPRVDALAVEAPPDDEDVPVVVRGMLSRRVEANIVVVDVGDTSLLMLLPPDSGFPADFSVGSRVEAVGLLRGTQTLGELTAPLVRTLSMRRAPGSR